MHTTNIAKPKNIVHPKLHLKKFGIKYIRFHDFHHPCSSLMLTAGIGIKVASNILGHSTMSFKADYYTKVVTDLKMEDAEKIDFQILIKAENTKK